MSVAPFEFARLLVDAADRDKDARGTFRTQVKALFGTNNRAVVKALGSFLQRPHGTLDVANLQLIAAAATSIADPNHIARLIEQLTLTELDLAIAPLDEGLQEDFIASLEGYSPAIQAKLLQDLIQTSTVRLLELAPFEALSEQAVKVLQEHLNHKVQGNLESVIHAVDHPGATTKTIELALSRLERFTVEEGAEPPEDLFEAASLIVGSSQAIDDQRRRLQAMPWMIGTKEGRQSLAENPRTPPEILDEISQDEGEENREVRENVAMNANAAPQTLDRLSRDGDPYIRSSVAGNPHAGSKTISRLSHDKHLIVGRWVALNSRTDPEILNRLGGDDNNESIRASVAGNPNVDVEMLEWLSHDPDDSVRGNVASNVNADPRILDELSRDGSVKVRFNVAGNPNTSAETLDNLSRSMDEVRMRVARNPNASVQTLDRLSRDVDDSVRKAVMKNPNRPDHLVVFMAEAELADLSVLAKAPGVEQIALPPAVLEKIYGVADVHDVLRFALRRPADEQLGMGVKHLAIPKVTDTATARAVGIEAPPPKKLSAWDQLPSSDDFAFDLPLATTSLDGQVVSGLLMCILRTPREINDAHKAMGNCLDTYVERARKGEVVIGRLDDPDQRETYAVAWEVKPNGMLKMTEVNSRFNRGQLPPQFEQKVEAHTVIANRHLVESLSPFIRSAAVDSSRVRRPARQAPLVPPAHRQAAEPAAASAFQLPMQPPLPLAPQLSAADASLPAAGVRRRVMPVREAAVDAEQSQHAQSRLVPLPDVRADVGDGGAQGRRIETDDPDRPAHEARPALPLAVPPPAPRTPQGRSGL